MATVQGASAPADEPAKADPSATKEEHDEEDPDSDEDEQLFFNPYTSDSWQQQLIKEHDLKVKEDENKKKQGEAHLVDGELQFEAEEHHGPLKKRNPNLVEGNILPEGNEFPKELYGKPIEEIDKLITDKTFCVIAPRFKKEYIYRFSSTRSFFLFTPWLAFRRWLVYVATNQYFDYLIILTILTNCIFLAMPEVAIAETAEYAFLAVYTLEMIIKMLARGVFINSFTYLRDAWNWLDFIVIISAYLTIVLEQVSGGSGLGNLQGIRTFRVFRVLRTVSIVPGLKTIVNALLRAFKMLLEVMLLILFCLMVFALFALQIYMGALRQKCVAVITQNLSTAAYSYAQYYNDFTKNSTNWAQDDEGAYIICGNGTFFRGCPTNYTCLPDIGENPNFGYTGFDHFGWAMLTSFQLITLDFWEDTYNKVLQSSGPWNVIFFILVVFFGAFYLLNLMLAVVAMSYEEEAESAGKKRKMGMFKPYGDPPKQPKDYDKWKEKEKEARNKIKKKKKKRKQAQQEHDPLKELARGTTNAVKAAVEMAYPSKKASGILPISSTTRPLGHPGPTFDKDLSRTHIQRKPMVKMPSKDSGTGNSVESSRSNGSKEGDYTDEGSYNSSTIDIMRKEGIKKPFLKQASAGMPDHLPPINPSLTVSLSTLTERHLALSPVSSLASPSVILVSSSGVTLTQQRGSVGDIAEGDDQGLYDEDMDDDEKPKVDTKGMKFCRQRYPDIEIIDVEKGGNFDIVPSHKHELINRNCLCCYDGCGGRFFVPWLKFQQYAYVVASEPLFDLFITLCIGLNTILMACEHHNQPDTLTTILKVSNYVFSGIFITEAVIKITAFSQHYFYNGWNVFDLVIVIASIIDMAVEGVRGLSVFRTFRLLRVFKLAQSWPTMKLLLSIIMNTLGALGNLTLILCIVIYIFAVIGLQLFNSKYTAENFAPDEVPRWHFKDIFHSFMMVFRVLCGEWIEPLWDCMRAADELCMAVFLPTLVLGNFIVLNLFLALLLNAFASDSLRQAKENVEDNKLKIAIKRLYDLCCCCLPKKKKKVDVNAVAPDDEDDTVKEGKDGVGMKQIGNGTTPDTQKKHVNGVVSNQPADTKKPIDDAFATKREQYSDFNKALAESKKTPETSPAEETDAKDPDTKDNVAILGLSFRAERTDRPDVRLYRYSVPVKQNKKIVKDRNQVGAMETKTEADELELGAEASTIKKDKKDEEKDEEDKTIEIHDCLCLPLTKKCRCCWALDETPIGLKWFSVRVFMNRVVEHKIFETIILILIAASSISLAFEDVNLYSKPDLEATLFWLNIIFVALFTLEMLMKWIAFGLKKYFSSFWCILDFFIVVISLASLIAESQGGSNFSEFRALRTLRALRPLRAISRWQGMRIVVNALMMAIPSIFNVLVVCVVFWLIFSIMGVQFFAGKFYKCLDASGEKLDPSVVPNKAACIANPAYSWKNAKINFDHVGNGYLALFQVATFEGWMELMEDAIDSTEVDEQPSYENSLYMYLYFVIFIIFGAFFTLNLFIGVIIDNFNMLKKKYDGSYLDMFLTSGQRQYYNTIKKLGNKKPQKTIKRPKNKTQAVFYDISISSKFELCIVVVIFFNMIVMAVEHYQQTETVTDVLTLLNIMFVVIFTLEAIVKIIGLRWHYFRQAWNVFDFIVVLLSILGIILDDIISDVFVSPTLLRVVRVFRIGRVLRLIKAAKGIRKLLFALIISLPALLNIGMLLFLVMYIYAIICMSTFQNLLINGVLDDDVVNFKTFVNSFLLLFRLSTAAGWNDVLETMLIEPPDCNNTHYQRTDGVWVAQSPGNCGTQWMAIFALTTFIIIIFLVVINTFIAVILENFNQAHEQEEVGVTEDDFDMFYVIWERYDPLATQFIKYEQLSNFVADLEKPLGIPKPNEIALVSFDLPIVEGDKLHCLDVLMGLVKYVLGNVEDSQELRQLQEQMEQRFQDAFPTRVNTNRKSTTMQRKKEDVAAKTLQRAWRSWKAQKQMKNIAALAMQQQTQKKAASTSDVRGKTNSIRNLGNRLGSALSAFFNTSRPSSAISRLSVKSATPSTSSTPNLRKKTGKVQSALEVPAVTSLYGIEKDHDIEL